MNNTKLKSISEVLSKQGINVVSGSQYDLIQIWKSWYRGNVNDFHRYTIKGAGGDNIECEKLTFGLPKKIAEDCSGLLWNENVSFNTNNDKINKQVLKVLKNNAYREEIGDLIEKTFGYAGTGAFVEYLSNGETIIDYITGEYILVTDGVGTQAKGLVTINEIIKDKTTITHLTIHKIEDNKWVVEHQAYESEKDNEIGKRKNSALRYIFDETTLENMREEILDEDGNIKSIRFAVIYDTTIPFFQLIRPNVTNNYDTNSRMGIPVTANSIDTYKALDNAYEGLNTEAVNNKTVVVFNEKATKKKAKTDPESGNTSFIQYVDKHDTRFISSPMNDTEDWVKHFAGTYTAEEYIKSINSHLSWGSFKAGLGTGYYSFDGTNTYVNEKQIISTNNDTWKNKVKHEIILEKAFVGLIKAIIFLEQSQGRIETINIDDIEITIKFDDSIIIDDEELKKNSLLLVADGYKPKWKHLVEWENMTEAEAKQSVKEAQEEDNINGIFGIGAVEGESATPPPTEDNEEEDEDDEE